MLDSFLIRASFWGAVVLGIISLSIQHCNRKKKTQVKPVVSVSPPKRVQIKPKAKVKKVKSKNGQTTVILEINLAPASR